MWIEHVSVVTIAYINYLNTFYINQKQIIVVRLYDFDAQRALLFARKLDRINSQCIIRFIVDVLRSGIKKNRTFLSKRFTVRFQNIFVINSFCTYLFFHIY